MMDEDPLEHLELGAKRTVARAVIVIEAVLKRVVVAAVVARFIGHQIARSSATTMSRLLAEGQIL